MLRAVAWGLEVVGVAVWAISGWNLIRGTALAKDVLPAGACGALLIAAGHWLGRKASRKAVEGRISEALLALLQQGEEGSFVLIEEPRSEKFVQFGMGRVLRMDVPAVGLTAGEVKRASDFFESLGEDRPYEYHTADPRTGQETHGLAFQHDFGDDTRAAAKAALSFFEEVYRFPRDVVLTLKRY
jgi:hypothetical protein